MEQEVRLDRIFRCGGDERVKRSPDRFGADGVHPGGRECRCLAFDSDSEVDHVQDVVVSADGSGFDGERSRLGHRQHERPSALESFDHAFGP
jgi:hypothetical protein